MEKLIELKRKIESAETQKRKVIDFVQKTLIQYQEKKITLQQYHEKLNASLKNKSAEEWLRDYDKYIEACKNQILLYKKQLKKRKLKLILSILVFAIVLCIPIIFYFLPEEELLLAPPSQLEIISNHSVWKYHDSNIDLADSWTSLGFDDSSWNQGPAKLGFGTNDGVFDTTLQDLNQITFYFRQNFNIVDVSQIETITLSIDYDDCYTIYINGNLLSTSANFVNSAHTTACSSVHNSAEDGSGATSPLWPTLQFTQEQLGWLQNGNNLIAVEVHQQSATSSDIVMMLNMQTTLKDTSPPAITIISPIDSSTLQDTTPLLNVTLDEYATITYQINSNPSQTACTNCNSTSFFLDLPEGIHALTITAQDSANNIASASSTFTINMQNNFFDNYDDNSSIVNLNDVVLVSGSIALSSTPQQNTLAFQGVSQIDDAEIRANAPNTNYGSLSTLNIDGQNPHVHTLIKFQNIFGSAPGQIPLGSNIISATLSLFCTNEGNNQLVYILKENWNENEASWNNRQAGIPWSNVGADGPISRDTSYSETWTCPTRNQQRILSMTYFVQQWSNSIPNYGIVAIDTGTNGADYYSSESATNPPVLTITYEIPGSNTGSFQSTYINTIYTINTIDSISWTETGTDSNNLISIELFDGSSWLSAINGGSFSNLNTKSIAYRASFTIQDAPSISLNDITIQWAGDATPPAINFNEKTPQDGTSQAADSIHLDIDIVESSLNRIVFNLYNSLNQLIDSLTTSYHYNFALQRYQSDISNKDLNIDTDTSGIAYNPATNTLFAVHNTAGNANIDELSLDGSFIREIQLTNFQDTEGIAYINTTSTGIHAFAIVEEQIAYLSLIEIDSATTTIDTSQAKRFNLGLGNLGNTGIEGVTYDSKRNLFYLVKEKTPKKLYQVNISTPSPTITELFDAETRLNYLSDLSDIYYDNNTDTLFILSHESALISNNNLDSTQISQLTVSPMVQPEGITFDNYGNFMFVVGEPDFFSKWSSSSFSSSHTFSNLQPNTYKYNAIVYDQNENSGSTETRTITLLNTPPTINDISGIPDQTVTELGTTNVQFTVQASDLNGFSDIQALNAQFSKAGEETRTGTCAFNSNLDETTTIYDCTVPIQYWDGAGEWIVTATAIDSAGDSSSYSETFILLETSCILISPTSILWSTLIPQETEKYSISNPLIIYNMCNHEGGIKIRAFALLGETNPAENIPAANFKVNIQDNQCSIGNQMSHNTETTITNALLQRGDNSIGNGKEELYFCLQQVPTYLPAQQYSTSLPWEITLLLALLLPRKKKSNALNQENLLHILDAKLKETYNITLNDLLRNIKNKQNNIMVPISIFNQKIGAAESLAKYLKENKKLTFAEIARILNRNQRTIWINYRNALTKKKDKIATSASDTLLPVSIFSNRKFSILESLVYYLKEKGFNNSKISSILNKDPRNISTLYSRAIKKLKNSK